MTSGIAAAWIKFCTVKGIRIHVETIVQVTTTQVTTTMVKNKRRTVRWNIPERSKPDENEPVTIELSAQAKVNLEKLQFRLLDKQGRQPGPSQVIEGLINAAAVREPDAHYPG